jgi:hypothetical protein
MQKCSSINKLPSMIRPIRGAFNIGRPDGQVANEQSEKYHPEIAVGEVREAQIRETLKPDKPIQPKTPERQN